MSYRDISSDVALKMFHTKKPLIQNGMYWIFSVSGHGQTEGLEIPGENGGMEIMTGTKDSAWGLGKG